MGSSDIFPALNYKHGNYVGVIKNVKVFDLFNMPF